MTRQRTQAKPLLTTVLEFLPRGYPSFDRLLPTLTAGVVCGITEVSFVTSLGALIFSGPLTVFVARGIGLELLSAVVMCVAVAVFSSFEGMIGIAQDSPAAILALVATGIAASLPAAASPDTVFSTVVAAIALTSLITGAVFLALGQFKLGSLTRFLPFPVVGGFLAGTGWLLALGAISTMVGAPVGFPQIGHLFDAAVLLRWLPGVAFGVVVLLALRRFQHFLTMPALLLSAVAVFYAVLFAAHISVAQAGAQGWLLGPFPQGALWQPLTPDMLGRVNWSSIFGQLDKIGTVPFVSAIAMLLFTSGIELAVRQDIDLNRELKASGLANLLAGLGGSPVGYTSISLSPLAYRMGGRGRLVGLVVAAFCAAVLLFGASLLSFFPKVVLGGLLVFLGLSFLVEWLYDGWFKLPRADYALVLVIVITVAVAGFLPGVAVGMAIAVVLFVVNYSRINVVRNTVSGASFHSTVDRPPAQRQLLREKGAQLEVLQLQGFVFFGTAQRLLDQIGKRIRDPERPTLQFILLDFARVAGFDSSAVSCFLRIKQLTDGRGIRLVFTALSPLMACQLEQGRLDSIGPTGVHLLPSLDRGLEWCEDHILTAGGKTVAGQADSMEEVLRGVFPCPDDFVRLMGYLEKEQWEAGKDLIHQGDPADCIYFVESGLTSAELELGEGRRLRLRTMRCGTVIGEVAMYLGTARSASVVTVQPTTLYRLSEPAIQRMEQQDPDIASALHKWIARLMAERLAENNDLIASLTN